MALINCPECGKEISDTCEVCIHCGYKLVSMAINKDTTQKTNKKFKYLAIIISALLVVALVIASILIVNTISEKNRLEQIEQERIAQLEAEEQQKQAAREAAKLTYEETVAYYAIQHFKTLLKNPDSLQIHDIYIAQGLGAEIDENGKYKEYVLRIEYSAQNGFGGNNRDTYYVRLEGFEATSSESWIAEMWYMESYETPVNVDKVKNALNNPEILNY